MLAEPIYPESLETLIAALRRLPGIGRRTAERLALAMVDWSADELKRFGEDVASLKDRLGYCEICGNFAEGARCAICRAPGREQAQVCVLEYASQIPGIEKTGSYRGLYHVLGGRIAPLDGRGPEDLRIQGLRERVQAGSIQELILATSSDIEGEATASFIAAEFATHDIQITRIAAGIPVGADLAYADAPTLTMAINRRRPFV